MMAPPRGKSPARSTPKRLPRPELETLSLLDVSLEDDSLLPFNKNRQMQRSPVDAAQACSSESDEQCTQGDPMVLSIIQENDEHLSCSDKAGKQDLPSPIATEEPMLKKKKKKTGFNLRKSLAWNNAFFTEEGVLDSEELSIVNRTFKKPAGLPKPDSSKVRIIPNSKLRKPMIIPRVDLSSLSLQSPIVSRGSPRVSATSSSGSGSILCSPRSSTGSITGGASRQPVNKAFSVKHGVGLLSSKVDANTIKQDKTALPVHREFNDSKPLVLNRVSGNDSRKIVGSHLPGKKLKACTLNRVQEACSSGALSHRVGTVVPLHPQSSFERLVQSTDTTSTQCVSRNGASRVSAERPFLNATGKRRVDVLSSPTSTTVAFLKSPSKAREAKASGCPPRLRKEMLPVSSSIDTKASGYAAGTTHPHSAKLLGGATTLLNSSKPSGLRMPSPKLGFFDTSRAVNCSQGAGSQERTIGNEHDAPVLIAAAGQLVGSRLASPINADHVPSSTLKLADHNSQLKPETGLKTKGGAMTCGIPLAPHSCSSGNLPMQIGPSALALSIPCIKLGSLACGRKNILQVQENIPKVLTSEKASPRQLVSCLSSLSGQENAIPQCQQENEMP